MSLLCTCITVMILLQKHSLTKIRDLIIHPPVMIYLADTMCFSLHSIPLWQYNGIKVIGGLNKEGIFCFQKIT